MITEAYIKGRFDDGIGKCAVVLVEGGEVVEKRAWAVKQPFAYGGVNVTPNQFDCEIMAAIWVCMWAKKQGRKSLNIYANTTSCQKWYYRKDFPDAREFGKVFIAESEGLDIFADYIPKADDNEFNKLVNELAVSVT